MAEITEVKTLEHLTAADAEKEGDRLLAENHQQQALEYFQQALKLFEAQAQTTQLANVYLKIGNLYDSIHDTENALFNFMESLNLVTSVKDEQEIIRLKIKIGHFYQSIYQFANSYEYFNDALNAALKINNSKLIQEGHYNLGNCLNWMEDHNNAFLHLEKAAAIKTSDDLIGKRIYGSTAILLYKMKDYQRSLDYFNTALELNDKTNKDISFRASILKSMGYAYFLSGK